MNLNLLTVFLIIQLAVAEYKESSSLDLFKRITTYSLLAHVLPLLIGIDAIHVDYIEYKGKLIFI